MEQSAERHAPGEDGRDGDERELETDVAQPAGFHSSIPKPAAASALSATYSDAEASANWSIVHITAARTALGENPAAATNSQMQTVASRLRTKCRGAAAAATTA